MAIEDEDVASVVTYPLLIRVIRTHHNFPSMEA